MWVTPSERLTLTGLGAVALLALGILCWQRQRVPMVLERSAQPAASMAWKEALSAARQVDINTADDTALARLPEVGPLLARRIVAYRQQHGRFAVPEELMQVRGVGPKTYEALKGYVRTE